VHDASQGYILLTEDVPGRGKNWYFILPIVHGRRPYLRGPDGKYTGGPDGRRVPGVQYRGLVIELTHGVAISWDGCVIRHCTSLSMPDGVDRRGYPAGRGDRTLQTTCMEPSLLQRRG
jgi:hypothetical protein